jgi:hypothetical protein
VRITTKLAERKELSPVERRRLEELREAVLRPWRSPEYFGDLRLRHGFDPAESDPGAAGLARGDDGFGVFLPGRSESVDWDLRPAENPAPLGSFGFVGTFAQLTLDSPTWGTLALRFDAELLGAVSRDSLRLFWWDEQSRSYCLLPVSGPGNEGDYVWGLVSRPGHYAAIGVNADPLVVRTLATLGAFSEVTAGLSRERRADLYGDICGIVLCPPPGRSDGIEQWQGLVQEQGALGWPTPPEGWTPGQDSTLCDVCLGLSTMEWMQIPEQQIVKDLSLRHVCIPPPECVPPQPLAWRSVGPTDVGAYTRDLALDPQNNIVYAATLNGGLWKLTWKNTPGPTTGYTWQPLTDQLDLLDLRVNVTASSPAAPGQLFMVDGYTRLRRSYDRGGTWALTGPTAFGTPHPQIANPRLTDIQRMVVDPAQPTRVLIATSSGLFEVDMPQPPLRLETTQETVLQRDPSLSRGGSERILDRFEGPVVTRIHPGVTTDVLFDPTDSTRLYAAVLGVGVVMRNVVTGGWDTLLSVADATALAGADRTHALIEIAIGHQGTPLSRRLAARFSARPSAAGMVVDVYTNSASGVGAWSHRQTVGVANEGLRVGGIAIDPTRDDTILVGAEGLFQTTDGGTSWQAVGPVHPDQHRILFDPTRNGLAYTSTDGGVFVSFDHGANWQDLNHGYVGGQIFYLAFSGAEVAGTFDDWGILASPTVGQTDWQYLEGGSFEGTPVRGDAASRKALYYLATGKIIRRSFPGTALSDYGPFQPHLGFAVDPTSASNVVLASENTGASAGRLHRTVEGDLLTPTWQVESGITLAAGDQVIAVAIVPGGNQRKAYAASLEGNVFFNPDVGPGRTGAGPWQLVSTWPPPSSPGGQPVRGLAFDPFDSDTIVVWSADAAAVSHTRGSLWRPITGTGATALPGGGIVSIVADLGAPHLYAGLAVGGVFESHDEGNSWHPLRRGLPNGKLTALVWRDNGLYATIFGRGVWRLF